jgi:pyrroloquinoline quinone biosynthesis protein B
MGHTAGLSKLGPEGMNVQGLPVYASAPLIEVLVETRLWRPLVRNLDLRPFEPGRPLHLATDLAITPLPVPHRDELGSGTFAMRVQGPNRTLLYLPDIDGWEQWSEARPVLEEVDVALVDASFYSVDELGGRPPVAHPLVPHTLAFWKGTRAQLVLTHFNHTNPVLDIGSPARESVLAVGAEIAASGQWFDL